jgi:alpha-amylase
VRTRWPNTGFVPVAWRGHDLGQPMPKHTDADGGADFWAPPRGYTVYVPATA